MQDPTELGRNRTGTQLSPLHKELLFDTPPQPAARDAVERPEATPLAALRRDYVTEADAFGTVPPPGTVQGMMKSGVGMLTGKRLHVFVDKIAERLAFERGGTRLYDAVIVKALTLAEGTPVDIDRLREIRAQEAAHANLLADVLRDLGADPTAQTPCADLVGVQSMGLLQSVSDPRSSLTQVLSSAMAAELIDVASWELLAELARSLGKEDLASEFERALAHENQHLESVRTWFETMVVEESRLM